MAGRLLIAALRTFAAATILAWLAHPHRTARATTKSRFAGAWLARTRTTGATSGRPRIFADVIEAAQFARLVCHRTIDVRAALAVRVRHMDFRARLALADHRLQGQHLGAAFHSEFGLQCRDLFGRQILAMPALEQSRQRDRAITHAFEPADLETLGFPQSPHFTITAFLHHQFEPRVAVAGTNAFDLVELGRAIVQRDAARETIDDVVGYFAMHAADVFAFDRARGMHQRVGEFAVGGEQQQAGGVDVEASDRDPARALDPRQRLENGWAAFGIFARGHFALGFVVEQHPSRFVEGAGDKRLAVEFDSVAAADALADDRDLAIDLDQAVADALLKRASGTQAGLRKNLVQALLELRRVVIRVALGGKGKAATGAVGRGLVGHGVCSCASASAGRVEFESAGWVEACSIAAVCCG